MRNFVELYLPSLGIRAERLLISIIDWIIMENRLEIMRKGKNFTEENDLLFEFM
jgi:hypothetical protein